MATSRRYGKKRVSKKGRKSRKVGKGRRVRKMKGGGLIKMINPDEFEDINHVSDFKDLNENIYTESGNKKYKITIEDDTSGPKMTWTPYLQPVGAAIDYAKRFFIGSSLLLNNFKKDLNKIYEGSTIPQIESITYLVQNETVTFTPEYIEKEGVKYNITKQLTPEKFKKNIVNLYNEKVKAVKDGIFSGIISSAAYNSKNTI